jgi:Cell Wall Hydrolase
MKLKHFIVSLLVVGSTAVAAQETQVAQVTFKDQMIEQANTFVERTVNMIATPFLSDRDVDCLARNIFYEAGSESTEGKVAVGMVTINRAQDPRYPQNVCGVVRQKTVSTVQQKTTTVKTVKENFLSPPRQVVETQTTWVQKVVCQFSWTCMRVPTPRTDDPRWVGSGRKHSPRWLSRSPGQVWTGHALPCCVCKTRLETQTDSPDRKPYFLPIS